MCRLSCSFARLLAAGHDVIIFPEGTRSRDGQTGAFHRGAARLAAAAGAPLVPAGISGTGTLLPPPDGTTRWPPRTAVIVRIGAPVSVATPAGRPVRASRDAVTDATAQARARWRPISAVAGRTAQRATRPLVELPAAGRASSSIARDNLAQSAVQNQAFCGQHGNPTTIQPPSPIRQVRSCPGTPVALRNNRWSRPSREIRR